MSAACAVLTAQPGCSCVHCTTCGAGQNTVLHPNARRRERLVFRHNPYYHWDSRRSQRRHPVSSLFLRHQNQDSFPALALHVDRTKELRHTWLAPPRLGEVHHPVLGLQENCLPPTKLNGVILILQSSEWSFVGRSPCKNGRSGGVSAPYFRVTVFAMYPHLTGMIRTHAQHVASYSSCIHSRSPFAARCPTRIK